LAPRFVISMTSLFPLTDVMGTGHFSFGALRDPDERAVRERRAHGFALRPIELPRPERAVHAGPLQSLATELDVPSELAKGAMTRSPGLTCRTSLPTSSTMTLGSWPVRPPINPEPRMPTRTLLSRWFSRRRRLAARQDQREDERECDRRHCRGGFDVF